RLRQLLRIVGVADPAHDPMVAAKPRRHVFAESKVRLSLDRDAVAVVDPTQIPQPEMARERSGFARDTFHHVSVAAQGINLESKHREVRPVEVPTEPTSRDGHTDAVAASLS